MAEQSVRVALDQLLGEEWWFQIMYRPGTDTVDRIEEWFAGDKAPHALCDGLPWGRDYIWVGQTLPPTLRPKRDVTGGH